MKFPLPRDTFPHVELPPHEAEEIEALSTLLVQKTLAQFHEHEVVNRGVVDAVRWKKVRQKDDIRVYKERSAKKRARSAAAQSSSSNSNNIPTSTYGDLVPVLMGIGTIVGDLDDVMFGVLNPTTESMRIKSTYADDGFLDGAVLATLVRPSRAEPLRSLTLRWFVKRNPLFMTPVVRMRDVVYIESTGVAYTKSGERIGYQLLHSVEIPGVRELTEHQFVRANVSFCYLYRQQSPTVVDVFMRGVLNPLGDVRPSMSVLSTAEALVSVATNLHCAQMKKLTWLLRTSKASVVQRRDVVSAAAPTHCRVCLQSLSSAFTLKSSRKRCAACLEPICTKCRHVHKLSILALARSDEWDVQQVKFAFCTRCRTHAFESSAAIVALADLAADDAPFDDDFILSRGVTESVSSCSTPPTSFSSSSSSRY